MHKKVAVFLLAARASFWRVLAVLAAAAALKAGAFVLDFRLAAVSGAWPALETILDGWKYHLVSALELVAVTAVLWLCLGRGNTGYTIRRLPVRRWWALAQWCAYGIAVYAVVWAVQLATALGLSALFLRWVDPMQASQGQVVFLASYRSALLHSLLPLSDGYRWFGTAALYGGLALGTAGAAAALWDGKWMAAPVVVAAAGWISAGAVGAAGWSLFLGVCSLGVGLWSLALVWKEERP